MEGLADRREEHVRALARGLQALLGQLRAIPEVHSVILFGSYARGRRDLLTDLDVVVVMDSELDFVGRTAELAGRLRAGVPLDLLVYTPEEWECLRERPFMQEIVKTGKVLYER